MSQNKLHSVFMVLKEHVVDVFFRTFWAVVGVSEPLRTQHLEVAVHRQLTAHSFSLPPCFCAFREPLPHLNVSG